ncbi:MAG: hypothetical protein ACI97A_004211 [Planctomycetota bacterium]|jgi:hypothetical protein
MLRQSSAPQIFFLLLPFCNVSAGQIVPFGFAIDTLESASLVAPNDFAFLPDGRILIAERDGTIRLKREGIIDVSTVGVVPNVLVNHAVRGLLSIAVRGDKIYTWATRSNSAFVVLARYTLVGPLNAPTGRGLTFDASSEFIVLERVPDNSHLHNGGTLRFGPDNMLYVSIGDDGDCFLGSALTQMGGKILRLDVSNLPANGPIPSTADIMPADNPFADAPNENQRLVLAYGLRNPFSMCIDGPTGDLFIADVGLQTREELNWYPRNLGQPLACRSYGWPWYQGSIPSVACPGVGSDPGGHTYPIDERIWGIEGNAIICSGVTRNQGGANDFGPAYEFNVFHCDFYNGTMTRLTLDTTSNTWSRPPAVLGQVDHDYWGLGFQGAVHFDLGPDGAIYFVQRNMNGIGGTLKRIRGSGPIYNLNFTVGDYQVCSSGAAFGAPITVVVTDINSLPVPGVTVQLSSPDGSAGVSPVPLITDANGEVTTSVSSTGIGLGEVSLQAGAIGALPVNAHLWGRKLEVEYVPGIPTDTITANFYNVSNANPPILPVLLAVTLDSEPVLPSALGDLYVNLGTLSNTTILEDGGGLFGFVNFGPTPPYGSPAWSSFYFAPSGAFAGLTYRFQMLVDDASILVSEIGAAAITIGRTNHVSITFQ